MVPGPGKTGFSQVRGVLYWANGREPGRPGTASGLTGVAWGATNGSTFSDLYVEWENTKEAQLQKE